VSQRQKMERLGLQELVDAVVISDEIGQVKPSAEAFNAALQGVAAGANSTAMAGMTSRWTSRPPWRPASLELFG
jgi:FMN phosphatase YigB (HAD superfamily)